MTDVDTLDRPQADETKTRKRKTPAAVRVDCDRAHLAKALARIVPLVEARSTIPVLSGVLFTVQTGCLILDTTNLDQFARITVPADAEVQGGFVILNAQALLRLVKLMEGERLTIRADLNGGKVTLDDGKTDAELGMLPAADFPLWSVAGGAPVDLMFGGTALIQAIDRVAFAISTEETRYYLNGIYLHGRNRQDGGFEPWLVATDGRKLALTRPAQELEVEPAQPIEQPFGGIIPHQAVPMLRDLAERGAVEIRLWDTKLSVIQDGFEFHTKLIDGTFPDYARVIPSGVPNFAIFSPAAALPAIRRVTALSKGKSAAVRIVIDKGQMALQMRDPEAGVVNETLALPGPATQRFEHGVNPRYLAQALGSFDSAVRYRWSDPASPIVITDADVPDHSSAAQLVVLMPMRV